MLILLKYNGIKTRKELLTVCECKNKAAENIEIFVFVFTTNSPRFDANVHVSKSIKGAI